VTWNEFICEYPSCYWYFLYFTHLCVLFGFCSKAEARRPMAGQVVLARAEALPLVLSAQAKKRKHGTKASQMTSA
jgi:hypothetical protein